MNSAVAGARCLGAAAAITDRKPFTVSTTTFAKFRPQLMAQP
ncbi:MAG TPA: hypothetical protein VNX66_19170 [Candidatus Sulfotelmatobacter sp.]|nr:hypothetical protein [Candidatus Sulfotelmatobacter sp.]